MAHKNVKEWNGKGLRPCDWCGKPLPNGRPYLHVDCAEQESKFYIQLGYDGESDVRLPKGYQVVIPERTK